MDEKLVNQYINQMADQLNKLQQENILLKSKLMIANEELQSHRQAAQVTQTESEPEESDFSKEQAE